MLFDNENEKPSEQEPEIKTSSLPGMLEAWKRGSIKAWEHGSMGAWKAAYHITVLQIRSAGAGD